MNEYDYALVIFYLVYVGDIVSSISGSMAGCNKSFDIIGVILIAFVTTVGGGTIRDLVLDTPIFWMKQHLEFYLAIIPPIILFFIPFERKIRKSILLWADAIGLAAFTAFGCYKSFLLTHDFLISIVLGTCTAVGGGIARDILCARELFIAKGEIYAAASFIGGFFFMIIMLVTKNILLATYTAFFICIFIRSLSIIFKISLGPRGHFIEKAKKPKESLIIRKK